LRPQSFVGGANFFQRTISEPLLPQQLYFALQFHVPDSACNSGESLVDVQRLGDEVVGSNLHCLHRIRARAVGGENDDGHGGQKPFRLETLEKLLPPPPGIFQSQSVRSGVAL
jgi:hypothetical protein